MKARKLEAYPLSFLRELEREGRIFDKAGRLRPNVSRMIFDSLREELSIACRSIHSLKDAFCLFKAEGRIPKYVPYQAFYSYFSKYGLAGAIQRPPGRAVSEDELNAMISALEKKGELHSKNGRLRPGLLGLVLEFYRGEVFSKLSAIRNIRAVFDSMEDRLPKWITFGSFRNYYRRFPARGSVLGSRKIYAPASDAPAAAEAAASQPPAEAPLASGNPAPFRRPAAASRTFAGAGAAKPVPAKQPRPRASFVPRGGTVVPPEGSPADTLIKLEDGRIVKAGTPSAPVRDINEWRGGIPKWRLPPDAEDKWERENDGREVPVIWEEEDYPYLERPGRLWIITKHNPAYPGTYPFKGTDMSMLADYGRHPALRYMQPMLISEQGRLYDLFYQLPLLANVEIKRDGTYVFFGYPGKFFHNAASYREMLSAKFQSNRDINPDPAKIAGRKA